LFPQKNHREQKSSPFIIFVNGSDKLTQNVSGGHRWRYSGVRRLFDQPSMNQFDKAGIMNMIRHLVKAALLGAALVISHNPFSGFAAVANVTVGSGGNHFSPLITNISVNDQILWTWGGIFHSTTSGTNGAPSGVWDSGINNQPHTFMNSFPNVGTFVFYCSQHFATGMTGAVIVAAANLPPSVSITNPVSGTVFAAPANVTIQASASDTDGTVTNVQFLVDANVVANDPAGPFSAVTNNLATGSHTLSAVASDNNGLKFTNSATISVVTPVTVLLSAPQKLAPANYKFSYTANAGLSYIIQRSTNLVSTNWTTLITNTAGSGSINFTDLNATFNPGFYRVGRLPNP
jgi:plastocyanin